MSAAVRKVTTYWSMQSPYCYFALDRLLALNARPDVTVELRPVRPGVLRTPERYRDRDALEQRYFDTDVQRTAAYLRLPFADPDPSPVAFMPGRWIAELEQPRIGRLYDLLMAAVAQGGALAFLDKVMRLIWDGRTPGWDRGDHLNTAVAAAGMDPAALAAEAEGNSAALAERLAANEAAMLADGHWGVPLFVLAGEPFYGQDRLDQVLWRLEG